MPTSFDALVPLLAFLASTVGAGIVAGKFVAKARQRWPKRSRGQVAALPTLDRAWYTVLYAPQYARWLTWLVASLVSLGATALLAYGEGTSVRLAFDGAFAIIISQAIHGAKMDTVPKYDEPKEGA